MWLNLLAPAILIFYTVFSYFIFVRYLAWTENLTSKLAQRNSIKLRVLRQGSEYSLHKPIVVSEHGLKEVRRTQKMELEEVV